MSPDNQINELTRLFKENAHDENAVHMAQYMERSFSFFWHQKYLETGPPEGVVARTFNPF
jgi:hypothetical protein